MGRVLLLTLLFCCAFIVVHWGSGEWVGLMGRLVWGHGVGDYCPAAGFCPRCRDGWVGVVVVVVVVVSLSFCIRVPEFLLVFSLPAFSHDDVGGRDPSSLSNRASFARSVA